MFKKKKDLITDSNLVLNIIEEVILLEASTPEVDDVIRIEDDTLRGDGRINSEHI